MPVHPILPASSTSGRRVPHDRLDRLAAIDAEHKEMALIFLSGYAPHVFDDVLDATEPITGYSIGDDVRRQPPRTTTPAGNRVTTARRARCREIAAPVPHADGSCLAAGSQECPFGKLGEDRSAAAVRPVRPRKPLRGCFWP
ncbi:MAG TPA: hypothetical protein VF482_00735 [Trebonia sp.]